MPAGMKYNLDPIAAEKELCNQKTIYRLAGGFNLEDDTLPQGALIPHLAPLAVDFATRKAKVVKNVKIAEDAGASVTSLKIEKGSFAYVGMFIGTGAKGAAVSAIDKTNPGYDTITVAAAVGAAVTKGQILFEASAVAGTAVKNVANYLNYAHAVKVEPGATVTAVGQAYEIKESRLYVPISANDKVTLTSRFMFI
ncbi:MAG: hypothetical protein LBS55_06535 [Prevotellaceae bacterium]|jgi:hypothetical protein|nr:hypothetical protein [Prevotellaceae bacterium]